MDPGNDEPFDRSPWRRLLGTDAGAPAPDLDRRILAEARRALTPHVARWWLPASLAATVLLAVLIVQWQLADSGAPAHVTESDVLMTPAPGAGQESAAPAESEIPAARAPAPPPAQEPAISAIEEGALIRDQMPATHSTADAADAATAVAAPAQERAGVDSAVTIEKLRAKESFAEPRTPEEWYAHIEALRAAGRIKEADAELARFKSEYPGWLESHQHEDP